MERVQYSDPIEVTLDAPINEKFELEPGDRIALIKEEKVEEKKMNEDQGKYKSTLYVHEFSYDVLTVYKTFRGTIIGARIDQESFEIADANVCDSFDDAMDYLARVAGDLTGEPYKYDRDAGVIVYDDGVW